MEFVEKLWQDGGDWLVQYLVFRHPQQFTELIIAPDYGVGPYYHVRLNGSLVVADSFVFDIEYELLKYTIAPLNQLFSLLVFAILFVQVLHFKELEGSLIYSLLWNFAVKLQILVES